MQYSEALPLALNHPTGARPARRGRFWPKQRLVPAPTWSRLGVRQTRPSRAQSAVSDPERHFDTLNYRTATGLLDHLVGERKQRRWHLKAKCLGRFYVDDKLELCGLYDWEFRGHFAL
jgi:hypothetical protein